MMRLLSRLAKRLRPTSTLQPFAAETASVVEAPATPAPSFGEVWRDWRFAGLKPTSTLWGDVEIRYPDPTIETHQDVLYVDWKYGCRWGLFNSQGSPIEAALDRDRGGELIAQVAEVPQRAQHRELDFLDEEVTYVGRFNPHFGHFLVEALPRYWATGLGLAPKGRLLFHSTAHVGFFPNHPFAKEIFGVLGLAEDSFVAPSVSTRFRSVLIPATSYRSQAYGHPVFRRLCREIGERLLAGQNLLKNTRPAWLSKTALTSGVSRFANEFLVEQVLEQAGVEIIYPESLTFTEQLRLFATRSIVMGTTGSAFHSAIFTPPPERLILIDQTDYKNSNFEMFDRLSGSRSEHYYPVGSGDVSPEGFIDQRAFPEPRKVAKAILDLL